MVSCEVVGGQERFYACSSQAAHHCECRDEISNRSSEALQGVDGNGDKKQHIGDHGDGRKDG